VHLPEKVLAAAKDSLAMAIDVNYLTAVYEQIKPRLIGFVQPGINDTPVN
jgi:hypothetical protein